MNIKDLIEYLKLILNNDNQHYLLIYNYKNFSKKNCELSHDRMTNVIKISFNLTKKEIISLYENYHDRLLIIKN